MVRSLADRTFQLRCELLVVLVLRLVAGAAEFARRALQGQEVWATPYYLHALMCLLPLEQRVIRRNGSLAYYRPLPFAVALA